jgi:hypothetical protein
VRTASMITASGIISSLFYKNNPGLILPPVEFPE